MLVRALSHRRPSLLAWVSALSVSTAPAALSAQARTDDGAARPAADTAAQSTSLAGSTAVALAGGVFRYAPSTTSYGAAVTALPFVTDHVQLGVVSAYRGARLGGIDAFHTYGAVLEGNYVFGTGPRWRGYAGGYAGGSNATNTPNQSVGGAQLGALYFLDPSVALQAEYQYGRVLNDAGPAFGRVTVQLQPYLFGAAGRTTPTPGGFGTADVAFAASYYGRNGGYGQASGTFAPYLTRWLQLGAEGQLERHFREDIGPNTASFTGATATGFARAYLPLSVGTQPFVGGFVDYARTSFGTTHTGLASYGPQLGVRHFLSERVAVDAAVVRQFFGTYTGSAGASGGAGPSPITQLNFGLVTRFGRAR